MELESSLVLIEQAQAGDRDALNRLLDRYRPRIVRWASGRLPGYAQPLFLRICAGLDATETFKQKKQLLVREGFDPAVVRDPLQVRDPQSGLYRPITAEIYAQICAGAIRL